MVNMSWIRVAGVAGILLLSAACSRSGEEGSRERTREAANAPAAVNDKIAHVRFIDADSVNDELWFGDMKLFSDVEKNAISEYKDAPAERREFQLRMTGTGPEGERSRSTTSTSKAVSKDETLSKNSEGLDAGKYYTIVAFDDTTKKGGEPTIRVVNDDTNPPAVGKAKVRIIHAAPGMEGIEVFATGRKDKIASESRFTSASMWQEVDPTDTSVEIRSTNDRDGIVRLPNFHIEEGKVYTFVVMGGEKNGTRLRAVPIVDSGRRRRG